MPRYFVAIQLSEEIRSELVRVQQELKKLNLFTGKFVDPENLHLTLMFLGELTNQELVAVHTALKTVYFRPFDLTLGKLGVFTPREPRVVWVDLVGLPVYELQKRVELTKKQQEKPWVSHVTLARIKTTRDTQALLDALASVPVKPISLTVSEFSLQESQLTSDGPIYTVIEKFPIS